VWKYSSLVGSAAVVDDGAEAGVEAAVDPADKPDIDGGTGAEVSAIPRVSGLPAGIDSCRPQPFR
jgi:formylmethanofuran:tetrahydromethanopterin formyltransferase